MPDRLASRVVNWWHKWETPHSHGAKLWKSIKHRLFGAQLHTHYMKVASSCAQCEVAVPATAKPKGYRRPNPEPERLFDPVTSDFFYLGELEGEECHWTNKKKTGVLFIQCRHSGYIHVLLCNVNAMTGKAAAKRCAQTWMGCWDVPSEILTDSGSAYISEWWKTLWARLGIHHLRCDVHQHRALPAEGTGKTILDMLLKKLASDKDVDWLEILFGLLRFTTTQTCTTGTRLISLFSVETSAGGSSSTIIHRNVRMHQHFSTRFRLVKRRPSASLRSFRQIG